MPAADLQAEQRVVEHRALGRIRGGRPGQQRSGPGVAQVQARVAAYLAEVVVVRLGNVQVQVLAQQGQQLRRAFRLYLGLERVPRASANLDWPNGAGNPA